jgi:hypothetical protein
MQMRIGGREKLLGIWLSCVFGDCVVCTQCPDKRKFDVMQGYQRSMQLLWLCECVVFVSWNEWFCYCGGNRRGMRVGLEDGHIRRSRR